MTGSPVSGIWKRGTVMNSHTTDTTTVRKASKDRISAANATSRRSVTTSAESTGTGDNRAMTATSVSTANAATRRLPRAIRW